MKYGSCRIRKSIEVNEGRCSLRSHICCWLGANSPLSRHHYGDCGGEQQCWEGGYIDGETGPEVLSGTGQQLAGESGKEAGWLEFLTSLVICDCGWTVHRVTDTELLSERSAGLAVVKPHKLAITHPQHISIPSVNHSGCMFEL